MVNGKVVWHPPLMWGRTCIVGGCRGHLQRSGLCTVCCTARGLYIAQRRLVVAASLELLPPNQDRTPLVRAAPLHSTFTSPVVAAV
ncbi:hypothetical protein GDO78_004912 [Eleutherodactylus coqui]|uniref:Uncharacterized protein n=1 Tax=Eleutherodactylus coqui TaxID=57060 RepID=A0A8J6FII3_ELECQ|nr:hypothetical protein GDO78_004912 [Eleutherodactylus coqui]